MNETWININNLESWLCGIVFKQFYFISKTGPFNQGVPQNQGMNPGMGPMNSVPMNSVPMNSGPMNSVPMNSGSMVPGVMNQMNQGVLPQQQQQMGQVRPMGPGGMMGQRMGSPMGMNPHQNFMGQQ